MIIKNFYADVLKDYETNLDVFFDHDTNAVFEPGREDGTPKFLFTEVTGYAILDFLLLYSITGNQLYIDKANKSATWISNHAQDESGGVYTRFYFDRDHDAELADKSFSGKRIYSFDTAICLRGMVAIYNHTKNSRYLESAIRMGDFLADTMIDENGEVAAIYDARLGRIDKPDPNIWSRCFGAFHSKVGEALVDLADTTKQPKYERAATALCNSLLRFQSPKGNFETSKGGTELHPHCYATEGLLHVGRMTSNEKFIGAAHQATVWALEQCEGGEIPQSFDFLTATPRSRFRTDALAQVLALASDLLQMERLDIKYQGTMDNLADKILSMKSNGDGYYQYGFYEREFNGKTESNTRSYWTNMFCLRGLFKYYLSFIVQNTYVALLAGGIGSRVWPISCENRPKPVSCTLLGDRSHLQETIRRYTDNFFIKPERIYILCSPNALEQATDQAEKENVPPGNCILEHDPKGTIPAVSLALEGIPAGNQGQDRFIIVTMSDNVISPYRAFQAAVTSALFTVHENDCMVSIGKLFDNNGDLDSRFGHMLYTGKIQSYRSYEVNHFIEKPQPDEFSKIRDWPGGTAWECGGVIFRESYYRKFVSDNPQSGNLAENLLSKAGKWSSSDKNSLKLATALLDRDVRFEDFGVPGLNLIRFYSEDKKFDRGDGNMCLGSSDSVDLLSCTNNLVISDQLPIEIYGLDGFVVIDNSVTNTSVIMPISEVEHLPGLYRLFSGSKQYEPFIKGGPEAQDAPPTTFVEKSPNAHATSNYGLVFAYNFNESISIQRNKDGLKITNDAYPPIDPVDFRLLMEKQQDDPKLVEHLVHVGALANSLIGGDLVLSDGAREALNMLCLYHDFGGYLNDEAERREQEIINEFEKQTKLDRRLLDSRIIHEISRSFQSESPQNDNAIVGLINDNVNSAVEFLKKRKVQNADLRDLVITLLQIQDSPHLYSAYKKGYNKIGLCYSASETDTIFTCFKIAENISNGRWLWKRRKYHSGDNERAGLLLHKKGCLEDFPFILSFTVKWLTDANICPARYINRLNDALVEKNSRLLSIVNRLQENRPLLLCDKIYIALISTDESSETEHQQLYKLLENGLKEITSMEDQTFQLAQLLELPFKLKDIEPHCIALKQESVVLIQEIVTDLYHDYWKSIKPHVTPEVITRLLS